MGDVTLVARANPLAGLKSPTAKGLGQVGRATESVLLVLDGSGSMAGTPWDELREAVEQFVGATSPGTSRVGLVVFGGSADLFCPFTADLGKVLERMPEEAPGGGTNMRGALALAATLEWAGPPWRVIFMSDGEPTTGDPVGEVKRLASLGIVVDTVACMGACDSDVLAEMAKAGGGVFVACAHVSDLARAFKSLSSGVRGLLGTSPRKGGGTG